MTLAHCPCAPLSTAAPLPRFAFWRRMRQAAALRQQRARLLLLDAHLLRDIGLTADQARTEATRPLWDAPDQWRG